ncbi:TBC1 domain family member 5 [Trichinella britovi]|uniref:TBC1 domain family member 5 n=2 Tax=Trichinella TaxID=6333 RepID=A0A0V1CZE7_TRIBR|nr:TBC1 domain family member 5 [Trichinella britovi]
MTEKPKVYSRYYEQWNILLKQMLTFTKSEMKTFAAQGNLRGNSFRSIYWRVFLECFPTNFKHWSAALEKSRQTYTSLHKEVILGDPRSAQISGDLQIDNPLSLHEKSTWRIYFSNQELLSKIRQDVTRTYPELKFFTSERIRRIMTELLFIYALQYPHISYKQGMHEILGLIIYAFSFDFEAFKNAEENGALKYNSEKLVFVIACDKKSSAEHCYEIGIIYDECAVFLKFSGSVIKSSLPKCELYLCKSRTEYRTCDADNYRRGHPLRILLVSRILRTTEGTCHCSRMNNSEHCRRFCIQYSQVECNYCISCNIDGRTCRCRVQLAGQISSLYTGYSIAHILVEFSPDATNMNNEQRISFMQLFSSLCLKNVFNSDYFEHDVFGLFAALMQIVQPFYFQDEDGRCKTKKQLNDIASKCPLMVKLQGVTDSLKHVDFPLYNHLQCLDIPVEAYGIRWFRLLFGREFFIEDLFVIWDIIFADGPPYSIIECFSVAMLCYISDILLRSDYMGCLKILMKYPSVEDIFQLISIAVFLQTRIDDYLHSSAFARHVDVVCSRPAESNKTLRKSYLPFSFNIFPRKKNSDSTSTSSSSLAEKLKKRYQRQSDDAVVNRRPIFPSNKANSSKSSRSSASSSSECVTSTEEILVKEKIRQLQAGIMLNASKQLDDYADYLDQVTREGTIVADTGALVNISAGLRNVSALLRDNFSSPARRHNRPPVPRAQHPRPRIVETPNMQSMDFAIEMGKESIPVDEAFQIDETFLSTRLKRENELVELRRNQS